MHGHPRRPWNEYKKRISDETNAPYILCIVKQIHCSVLHLLQGYYFGSIVSLVTYVNGHTLRHFSLFSGANYTLIYEPVGANMRTEVTFFVSALLCYTKYINWFHFKLTEFTVGPLKLCNKNQSDKVVYVLIFICYIYVCYFICMNLYLYVIFWYNFWYVNYYVF